MACFPFFIQEKAESSFFLCPHTISYCPKICQSVFPSANHLFRRHQNRCRNIKDDSDVQKSKNDKHKPYHRWVYAQIFSNTTAYTTKFAIMIRSA